MIEKYLPVPVDTDDIRIPASLNRLVEVIAKNTHDVWAETRIAEGWTYGEVRNDAEKTTPCLVAYEELPESEKEYDRKTAIETIKLIIKLGYRIKK